MRKFLAALVLLASTFAPAQTFDSQAAAAHAALTNLQAAAEAKVSSDGQQIAALITTNTQQAATIQTLQSTFTWRSLEYNTWRVNSSSQVGGSGNGTASQTLATGPGTATFSIAPLPPATSSTNYFDAYYTLDFAPDESKRNFRYTLAWMFPTQTDANASQCLEMEIRQSLKSGLMAVWALQMQFSGKQLRIWDQSRAWFSTGTAQPRLTPGVWYAVTLEGHRDDATVFYDAITINAMRIPLGYSYPMWDNGWRPMTRVAAQLDGNGAGIPYKVKRDQTSFASW